MENFNIKKFLVENRLTTNSKAVKESTEEVVSEFHSTSNITHKGGKESFNNAVEDILLLIDQIKPGSSFDKNLVLDVKEILTQFGEDMLDLGTKLTQDELGYSVAAENTEN